MMSTTETDALTAQVGETSDESTATPEVSADAEQDAAKGGIMQQFITESKTPPQAGDLVEGPVISIGAGKLFIDLPPFGTGIIYGREYIQAADILRKVNIGDLITAKVTEAENKEGYVELSLQEARQALIWSEAETAIAQKNIFSVPVREANKGGLILEWNGIQGFLPASQLKPEHYPRVESGNKDLILEELKKLVGEKLSVVIITADSKEGKLIFSEKSPEQKDKSAIVDNYEVGDALDGEVTGAVDFGVFVKIEDGLEGLVHISELDWGLVEDPRTMYKVGDKVRVKVIEIKDGKISLSIKALKENPWHGAKSKYSKGDVVSAVIIKYNKHGALASIEEGVAGLVHISEFETAQELHDALELGKTYQFKITLFEPDEHRMTLSYKQAQE